MPILRKPDISLSGIQLLGRDVLYDDRTTIPGNHLRWSFNAEMGFPPDGFTLSRAIWNPQFNFGNNHPITHVLPTPSFDWEVKLNLPRTPAEALNRIRQGFTIPELNGRFNNPAIELVETAAQLTDVGNPLHQYLQFFEPNEESGLKTKLRKMDTLLLAALDPYLARMMGLYFIDNSADSGQTYLYKITGHWGDNIFPKITVDFGTLSIRSKQQVLQFGPIKILSGGRYLGVRTRQDYDFIEHPQLSVSGEVNPGLKIYFDFPVEEVILDYDSENSTITSRTTLNTTLDGVRFRVRLEDKQIRISRPGNAFMRLEFIDLPSGYRYFYRVHYKKKIAPIGDQSGIFILDPAASEPIRNPVVTQLIPKQMPPILNEFGEINNEASQVSVSAGQIKLTIENIDAPTGVTLNQIISVLKLPTYPIRMLFGSSSPNVTNPPQRLLNLVEGVWSPALFRENSNSIAIPELIGYWPLNGGTENAKDGAEADRLGRPKYVREHLSNESAFSIQLNGQDALVLSNQDHLKNLGEQFTLEASIKIDPSNTTCTIIGNRYRTGFWLGLAKSSDGNFRLRFYVNGTRFESTSRIPSNQWLRVTATYSGSHVWFQYSDPSFVVPEDPIAAALGSVNIPTGNITIGAENSATAGAVNFPYIGKIADVCIWQRVIHPSESSALLAKWGPYLSQQQSTAEMVLNEQKTYLCTTTRDVIRIDQSASIKALGSSFSIFLYVYPLDNNIVNPTLIGNKFRQRLWVGLNKSGSSFKIRIYVNGRYFDSTRSIPFNAWSHVGISYDGRNLSIFINGIRANYFSAVLGALAKNDLELGIGSDVGTTNVDQQYRFNGFIQGIQFWRKAITINEWLTKISSVQHIDKFLENGRHNYRAKGVDLYGRTSSWSGAKKVVTLAAPSYQPPVNVHAEFLPLQGVVNTVIETQDDSGDFYEATTNLDYDAAIATKIEGYDAIISRMIELPNPLTGVLEMTKVEQLLEITSFTNVSGNSLIKVKKVPFAQLFPSSGDSISIKLDYRFRLKWAWTGTQQLYFPEVNAFKLFELKGTLNEITGRISEITSVDDFHHSVKFSGTIGVRANELNGEKCLIGPHMFTIESHTTGSNSRFSVVYSGSPPILPKKNDLLRITLKEGHSSFLEEVEYPWLNRRIEIPVGEANLQITNSGSVGVMDMVAVSSQDLRNRSPLNESVAERQALLKVFEDNPDPNTIVDWFPLSRVYKLTFTRFPRPDGYVDPVAPNYIPGALVFFDSHPERRRWRSFYVLWHSWETSQRAVVYVTPGEGDEAIPVFRIDVAHPVRLYLGKQFSYEGQLSSAPNITIGQATLQYHLALTAKDNKRRESKLSRMATVVAVNRKRPPIGPKPDAIIKKKADYYDQCKVEVSWDNLNSPIDKFIKYKLYRAIDSAIYTRDLELRRTQQAFYRGLSPTAIFADDADFDEWFATLDLDSGTTIAHMFPKKETTAWQNMTPIWRKWADRFYPALTNDELNVIGMRAGNEKAFALITGKPISENRYTDSINGIVKNRYYYRLRLINDALSESSIWGSLSDPIVPPIVMAPRQPVFTKVEAGDRQVTLHWALNREPDLKEYLLYRAETKKELEDLRWWSREADPRIIATILDPRITTLERGISLPATFEIAPDGILGLYLLEEFDSEATPPTRQPRALNYWNPTPADTDELASVVMISPDGVANHEITNLRRIANGKAVAVVFRGTSVEVQGITQLQSQPPYTDEGLEGLKDYYYRLGAVNNLGLKSYSSETKRARTLELQPPKVPKIILERGHSSSTIDFNDLIITEGEAKNLEIFIQKRKEGSPNWETFLFWSLFSPGDRFSDEVGANDSIIYMVSARTANKLKSEQEVYIYSDPIV